MLRHKADSRRKPKILFWVLLALTCVLGMELAVCRVAAPEVFQRITAPVRQAAQQIRSAASHAAESFAGLLPEETVDQTASEPALPPEQPVEDASVTAFTLINGLETLTGGTIPVVYFNQGESPWSEMSFGSDPVATHGCGPTAMSMVVSSLAEESVDPGEMASWAAENGYCAPSSGSYLSIVEGTARAYGLSVSSWESRDPDDLLQALSAGSIFVALMTRGHFTDGGHFIVLRGATLEGGVLVADPNSRDRSLTAWDPQLILDELSSSSSSGAPLWCFPVESFS